MCPSESSHLSGSRTHRQYGRGGPHLAFGELRVRARPAPCFTSVRRYRHHERRDGQRQCRRLRGRFGAPIFSRLIDAPEAATATKPDSKTATSCRRTSNSAVFAASPPRRQCQPPKHLDDRQVQHPNHHGQFMTDVNEPPAHTPCDGFWHGTGNPVKGHRAGRARYYRRVLVLVDERHIGSGEVRASASAPLSSSTSFGMLRRPCDRTYS
jgi:hypothetical protein